MGRRRGRRRQRPSALIAWRRATGPPASTSEWARATSPPPSRARAPPARSGSDRVDNPAFAARCVTSPARPVRSSRRKKFGAERCEIGNVKSPLWPGETLKYCRALFVVESRLMKRGSRTGRRVAVAVGARGVAACLAFALFPACGTDDPSQEPTTDIRRSAVTMTPAFVQGNYAVPQTLTATVPVTFTAAQAAGDLNVAIVGWTNNNTAQLDGRRRFARERLPAGGRAHGHRQPRAVHLLREEHRRRPGRRQHRDRHVHRRRAERRRPHPGVQRHRYHRPAGRGRRGEPAPTTAAARR